MNKSSYILWNWKNCVWKKIGVKLLFQAIAAKTKKIHKRRMRPGKDHWLNVQGKQVPNVDGVARKNQYKVGPIFEDALPKFSIDFSKSFWLHNFIQGNNCISFVFI